MKKIKIAIGSDHAGFELKEKIRQKLEEFGYESNDMGTYDKSSIDYPLIARAVSGEVACGNYDKGVLVCGSGIGVAIAANKISGIRAANCNDLYSARMCRLHNDANILTMGGRVVGEDLAYEIVKVWLETEFEGDRHQRRVDMIE